MSAAFLPPDFREERGLCAKCHCESDDLTALGKNNDLCRRCFREAIADLDLKEQEKQDNSGAWEV